MDVPAPSSMFGMVKIVRPNSGYEPPTAEDIETHVTTPDRELQIWNGDNKLEVFIRDGGEDLVLDLLIRSPRLGTLCVEHMSIKGYETSHDGSVLWPREVTVFLYGTDRATEILDSTAKA